MTTEEVETRLRKMRTYRNFIIESNGPKELLATREFVQARLIEVGHSEKLSEIVFDT